MMKIPQVTVLMSVFNGDPYLRSAMESILAQEFSDFEFVIVDDGSTDGSAELIGSMRDPRIRLIRAPHGGLVSALNLGLSQAQGRYVARMDADDIARTDRLGVQVAYLDANPATGLVCSNIRVIDERGRVVGSQREDWSYATHLRDGLLYLRPMKPVIHPSVMMRREVAEKIGGYRDIETAEDRDFWLRALDHYHFAKLDQDLLDYRIHVGGISRENGSRHEVSSAMSAINWLVNQHAGVDMFADRQDLFASVTAAVRKRIEREVLPGALAFRSARATIRSGKHLAGILGIAKAVARHGNRALPDGAREGTRLIIEDIVASTCNAIFMKTASWTT